MQSYGPVPPPPGDAEQGRRSARRWVVPLCVLGVLAALVPLLWVTGGLKETPKQPSKPAGKPLDAGLFDITVRDARIGMAKGDFGSGPERFLIVRMRVANKGKETESLGTGGLADGVGALTKDGKWVKPDQVEGVAAGAETNVAQPGLPVEASAMWKLHPDDSPAKLTVGLREWKYEHGFTDNTYTWAVRREGGKLVGRFSLPVAAMSATPRPTAPAARPTTTAQPTPTARASRPATRAPVPGAATGAPRPTASRP
ncbi:hypothetical protein E1281_39350 [Actinomadura sp. KC345]|uniref:hypothetical protein n=1 Tax=Actinomadura sp. KC345 TaxID=2530371 RepID=UPI00104A80D4|nr:hypothetical protein [Actinomadura sp. KC345]TDC37852.1 hypothetical protein E1281_39350 [Actinomadura sp. KC345]